MNGIDNMWYGMNGRSHSGNRRARLAAKEVAPARPWRKSLPCKRALLLATTIMGAALQATDWYVSGTDGTDSNAGTSWASARQTISSAYASASDGDVVHVADGVYPRIALDGNKSVTIRSEGGWANATIDANRENRCAYLGSEGETNIVLQGFTLTNGFRDGSGAGAYAGTLRDCRIVGNEAARSGGAAYGSALYGCLIVSNVAGNCAGAVYGGKMVACQAYFNVATNWGGAFYGGVAENCVIAGNSCGRYGGGAYETTLFGCTVFGNSAGLGAGGVYDSSATNSIIWENKVGSQVKNYSGGAFGNCVLYPLAEGIGNSSENPRLLSVENLDGHICVGSPCFNTGDNDAVHESVDVEGSVRIQQGTVDIGAYEGVVNEEGDFVEHAEKTLHVKPGVTSSFSFDDGSRSFVFGIAPLSAGDFEEIADGGILEYVNTGIIDAEKSSSSNVDDLWCQQMTEVNLCVWTGWSQYVGFLNEDDFADFLREREEFVDGHNILKWVMGKSGYNYDDYVSWSWASDPQRFVDNLTSWTREGERWIYLQLDWVTPGTTDVIGSHAVTCCGYQLASGKTGSSPEDLIGLYIINSDNDDCTGIGGRYAPNSVTRIPVAWDGATQKFFLTFPGATGMARFMCYLKVRPYYYDEAAVPMEKGAVPYSWLVSRGVYDPTTDDSPEAVLARPTGKPDGLGGELTVWHDFLAGTNPLDENDRFSVESVFTNGHFEVAWHPNLGDARCYTVYGKTNLTDAAWHFPTNEGSRFFMVGVEICETVKANGFGFIDGAELVATNRFVMSKGALSLYSDTIVDAEKIDGTDLDDRGCGEAVGANMSVMTGWAQLAGFADEDDVFRRFYQIDGTADYGTLSVIRYVFESLPGYSCSDYYENTGGFDETTFSKIEEWLNGGYAVGIKYLHGTPSSNEGDHVVTLWGVCKDLRYLPADPRHYSAVIISDSDDDKHGYATAKEAPNRVKVWPVSWDEADKVYYVSDGFLVDARSLAPAPGHMTECVSSPPESDLLVIAEAPVPESTPTEIVPALWTAAPSGAVSATVSTYDGYLCKGGVVAGTIQVKVGRANNKTGLATVTATVVLASGRKAIKAADRGKAKVATDGPTTVALVGGDTCEVTLGAKGMSGKYGAYAIDGALNVFASREADDKAVAAAVLGAWQGAVNVAWEGKDGWNGLSVSIAAKGKAKVAGTLADGTRVTANGQLVVGEEWCCVPVLAPKANLAFVLWLPMNGRAARSPMAVGLGEGVKAGKPGSLKGGARFHIDADAFSATWGQAALPYLPDGVVITESGGRWTLPKAGKVVYEKGTATVDPTKTGDNPSGLKLTYKAKDGTFKGSFKAYADANGKPKATTVNVAGVLIDGVGYGAATVKRVGGVPVTIE